MNINATTKVNAYIGAEFFIKNIRTHHVFFFEETKMTNIINLKTHLRVTLYIKTEVTTLIHV